jgi:hypothetical protein
MDSACTPTKDELSAGHEATHAVVRLLLKVPFDGVTIDPEVIRRWDPTACCKTTGLVYWGGGRLDAKNSPAGQVDDWIVVDLVGYEFERARNNASAWHDLTQACAHAWGDTDTACWRHITDALKRVEQEPQVAVNDLFEDCRALRRNCTTCCCWPRVQRLLAKAQGKLGQPGVQPAIDRVTAALLEMRTVCMWAVLGMPEVASVVGSEVLET